MDEICAAAQCRLRSWELTRKEISKQNFVTGALTLFLLVQSKGFYFYLLKNSLPVSHFSQLGHV
jgi:hypothetical protein